jgi:hypothetical protein
VIRFWRRRVFLALDAYSAPVDAIREEMARARPSEKSRDK